MHSKVEHTEGHEAKGIVVSHLRVCHQLDSKVQRKVNLFGIKRCFQKNASPWCFREFLQSNFLEEYDVCKNTNEYMCVYMYIFIYMYIYICKFSRKGLKNKKINYSKGFLNP